MPKIQMLCHRYSDSTRVNELEFGVTANNKDFQLVILFSRYVLWSY